MVVRDIVRGIEEQSGERCPCLHDYIDGEALGTLVEDGGFRFLRFEVEEYDVTVYGDGEVDVREN